MSSRARRLVAVTVEPYDWGELGGGVPRRPKGAAVAPDGLDDAPAPAVRAAIERDAFAHGFAQGERAGAEAASARGEAALERLTQTLADLQALRAELIQKTEKQVVQLAIAIARRIVHREISLDPDLVATMARVALDRLGEGTAATIRLHPDDYASTVSARAERGDGGAVRVVADAAVRRGGCVVQSDFGSIDVSADAQIQEMATALLGAEAPAPAEAPLAG